MNIFLNDREEELPGETISVKGMLELNKFSFRMRIIKINGRLIPRESYDSELIRNGDKVQMIYLMSGG